MDAQHFEHAFRRTFAHALRAWMVTRLVTLPDHVGEDIANAGFSFIRSSATS